MYTNPGNLWGVLLWIFTPFAFLATIRLSLKGIVKFPEHPVFKFLFSEIWCVSIIIYLPWYVAAFAHGEISPLPWNVFTANYEVYGLPDALLSLFIVCIVDIWLLWTPSQIYVSKLRGYEKEKAGLARAINGLAGLLLFTPGHPLYRLIELV